MYSREASLCECENPFKEKSSPNLSHSQSEASIARTLTTSATLPAQPNDQCPSLKLIAHDHDKVEYFEINSLH